MLELFITPDTEDGREAIRHVERTKESYIVYANKTLIPFPYLIYSGKTFLGITNICAISNNIIAEKRKGRTNAINT